MSDAYCLGQLRKSLIKACIWQVARHEHLLSGTEAKSQMAHQYDSLQMEY